MSTAYQICKIPISAEERKEDIEDLISAMDEAMKLLTPLEEKVVRMRTGYMTKDDIYGALRMTKLFHSHLMENDDETEW